MNLLVTVFLTCTLLYTAESLRCHVCANEVCSNSTSVECPSTSTACRTITSVKGTPASMTVNKNCSSLLTCVTPISFETEWSVNQGYTREAHTQLCCITDNCNFQTLAIPNFLTNGKLCPACASSADSLAGTCNATLTCMGAEDSCFSGNITSNSGDELQLGCLTRNLCSQPALTALFGSNSTIACGAPWSVRISAVLLAFALTAHKVLV